MKICSHARCSRGDLTDWTLQMHCYNIYCEVIYEYYYRNGTKVRDFRKIFAYHVRLIEYQKNTLYHNLFFKKQSLTLRNPEPNHPIVINSWQNHEKYLYGNPPLWVFLQVLKYVERGDQQENVGSRRKDDARGRNVGIPHEQLGRLDGKWKSGHQMYHIPPTTVNLHVSLHWHEINTALHFSCTFLRTYAPCLLLKVKATTI